MAATKLQCACRELITTEESYVHTLQVIVTVFERPLRTWAAEEGRGGGTSARKGDGVNADEVNALFGSVETLLEVNSEMLGQYAPQGIPTT